MFGMLLFPKSKSVSRNKALARFFRVDFPSSGCSTDKGEDDDDQKGLEYTKYFQTILDAFISMLVLLTTANNPDGECCNSLTTVVYM